MTDVSMADKEDKPKEKKPMLGWVHMQVVDDDGVQKSVKGQYSCEPFFTETAENGDMTLTAYFSPTNPLKFVQIEDLGKPSFFAAQFCWGKQGKPGSQADDVVCTTVWAGRAAMDDAFEAAEKESSKCQDKKTIKVGSIPVKAVCPHIKNCHNRELDAKITLRSHKYQLRVVGVEVALPKDIYEEWYARWDLMRSSAKDDDKKDKKDDDDESKKGEDGEKKED